MWGSGEQRGDNIGTRGVCKGGHTGDREQSLDVVRNKNIGIFMENNITK